MNLKKLARRYIMGDKKNTLLIVISIVISIALFLVMNIISEDVRNLMINQAKKELGTKHVAYSEPSNEELKYLEHNPDIKKIGKSIFLGLHEIGKGQILQILWDDEATQEMSNSYTLKNGRFPIKEDEIAVDTWYIKQCKIKEPIGKKIKLDYIKQSKKGVNLYTNEKEFKIVGVLESNPILKAQGMSVATINKAYAMKNMYIKNKYDQVVFMFKKEVNIQKKIDNFVKDRKLKEENITLNRPLILAMSDSLNLKIPYILVNIVIALATILLIYNIFYRLMLNRAKDFGILKTLGFIPSDISKIIVWEVFIYSIISIPIGIVIGKLIVSLCSEYMIGAIYDINYINLTKDTSHMNAYIYSILLSALTIIISVLKPLIEFSKIDPMTCIKRTEREIVVRKQSFINRLMTKLYNDYGNIALKNVQRNQKRTNLVIVSISLVFFLILTVYSKATSNFLNDGGLRLWIPGDFLITNIDSSSILQNTISYDKKILKEIENINGVKKVNAHRNKYFITMNNIENINKKTKYWKENKGVLEQNAHIENGKKIMPSFIEVLGVEDNNILNKVLIEGKGNLSKLDKEPYILIDKKYSESLNVETGDKINLNFNISDTKTGNYKETISKEFIVGGIITNLPIISQGVGTSFGAVMHVNQMDKFTGVPSYERFDVWTSKLANNKYIERELNKIVDKSGKGLLTHYKDEASGIEKSDNQKNMVMIIVIGVIVVLSMFNCCNIIVVSIKNRRREFALLRGIGISKDEIKGIIKIEGIIYLFNGVILSIIPSLIVRLIIIKDFETIKLINLKFIGAVITIVVFLVIIIMITIIKVLKDLQSEDFIEQIKTLQ
ncbi:FtsX-like permease family protein [Clostridioides difficile]